MIKALALLLLFALAPLPAVGEEICVKYRGCVPMDTRFDCAVITTSTFIHRTCYAAAQRYLIIVLGQTPYHYCGVPSETVSALRAARSPGGFYNREIRRRFDCRLGIVPDFGRCRESRCAGDP